MKLSPTAERALRKEREVLLEERGNVAARLADLDRQIGELDHDLGESTVVEALVEIGAGLKAAEEIDIAAAREANRRAMEACEEALKPEGAQYKTAELHNMLVQKGILLRVEDPERRLGQLLSARSDLFQSDRKNGWTLKGREPAGAGSQGATTVLEEATEERG